MLGQDLVVHGGGADDAAEPALERAPQAEQAHHVARVGVVGQVGVGLVAAHVDVAVGPAVVVDVAQQLALGVLVERGAHVAAEAPEDEPDVLVAVALHRQPAQHHEAAALVHLGHRLLQALAHDGQGEVLALDLLEGQAGGPGGGHGAIDVGDLGVGQRDDPGGLAGEGLAAPGLGTGDRGHAHLAHGDYLGI